MDCQNAVCQLSRRILYANRPTQGHLSIKMAIASFGTKMRHDSLPRAPFLLFATNAQLVTVQANLDLTVSHPRQCDAHANRVGCLAKVDRRRPCAVDRRHLRVSGLPSHAKKSPDAFRPTLNLDNVHTRLPATL